MDIYKTNKITTILCLVLVAGCAGRDPNPVPSYRVGDDSLTCSGIKSEMAYIDTQVAKLIPKSKKTGKNVALGVAGWFLLVPWFFMDFSEAEKIEIRAYQERYLALEQLWEKKSCNEIVASEAGSADEESAGEESAATDGSKGSVAMRLEVLDALLREEVITQEEYESRRAEILDEI